MLLFLCFQSSPYKEIDQLFFHANQSASFRNGSSVTELKCLSNEEICSKYSNLVINCTYNASKKRDNWKCSGYQTPYRFWLPHYSVFCEGWDGKQDKNNFVEGSCHAEIEIDEDVLYTANFYSIWYLLTMNILPLTVLSLGIICIYSWTHPDFSLVIKSTKSHRKKSKSE